MKRTTVHRCANNALLIVSQLLPWAAYSWSYISRVPYTRSQGHFSQTRVLHPNKEKSVKWTLLSQSSDPRPGKTTTTTTASQLFMVDPWRDSEQKKPVPIVLDGKRVFAAATNETAAAASLSDAKQTIDSPNSSSSSSSSSNNNKNNTSTSTTTTTSSNNEGTVNGGDMMNAQFGQAVPLKKRPTSNNKNAAPDSVMNSILSTETTTTSVIDSTLKEDDDISSSSSSSAQDELSQTIQNMKRRNLAVACLSVVLAVTNYLWQWFHPVTPVQLLAGMQQSSAPLTVIGRNAKPTVVDFWAPWCDNCKLMAPTLQAVEQEYADRVNFILVNGDDRDAWSVIEAFGVDAIPHLALVDAQGDVKTALIGPVPKRILSADLNVLLHNAATCGTGGESSSSSSISSATGASVAATTSTSTLTPTPTATATATVALSDKESTTATVDKEGTQSTTSSSSSSSSANTICVEQPLPYTMLDVFEGRPPEQRRLRFTE